MPKVTYQESSGRVETFEVTDDTSVMKAALNNGVNGIVGECGGQAMCATCHVYVSNETILPEISEEEEEMLDCTSEERCDNSRLSCQLIAGRDFDELVVQVPDTQI